MDWLHFVGKCFYPSITKFETEAFKLGATRRIDKKLLKDFNFKDKIFCFQWQGKSSLLFGYFVVNTILGAFPKEFYDELNVLEQEFEVSHMVRECGQYTITCISDVETSIPELASKIEELGGKHIMIGGSYHPHEHIRSSIGFQQGYSTFDYKGFMDEYKSYTGIRKKVKGEYRRELGLVKPKKFRGKVIQIENYITKKLIRIKRSLKLDPEVRYADFTFYYLDGTRSNEVPKRHPLQIEKWYELEVAVRAKRKGIIPDKRLVDSLVEPEQKEAVKIMVTAESDGKDFKIEEPVQELILPAHGDSVENAWFKVRPKLQTQNKRTLAKVQIRLYYEFNLLEVATIRAEVVGKFDKYTKSLLGLKFPITFRQERLEREYINFDNIRPRAMHIDITRKRGHFVFHFLFYNDVDKKVEFSAPCRLSEKELSINLKKIRDIWYNIAMSKTFSSQLRGKDNEFLETIHRLASEGRDLWNQLVRFDINSSLKKIGQWLKEHPLKQNSIIQVSFDKDAASFVFPWALIYDYDIPKEKYKLPALKGFWGYRYCIEQQIPKLIKRTDYNKPIDGELNLGFMLWGNFRNANAQKSLMKKFMKLSKGRLRVSDPPITNAATCLYHLDNCVSHILYFYAHGFSRHNLAEIGVSKNLQLFKRLCKDIEKDPELQKKYKDICDEINNEQFEKDDSWIELTHGKLYLRKLYDNVDGFQTRPFVFLNMCESAQVTPSFSDSFIHFFLNRGAKGVIGTECPMTVEFAHPFSEKFLHDILSGKQVGITLLKARRHFLRLKNPLGLAYTLFGPATVCFKPPRI